MIKVTTTKFIKTAIIIGALMLLVLPVCAGQIYVTGIDPSSGFNNGTIPITNLSGSNFSDKSDTYLQQGNVQGPRVGPIYLISSGQLACSFDLTGLAKGPANVTVFDKDNPLNNGTLVNGFYVNNPPPVLTSILPDNGLNNGITNVSFVGTGILAGATANMTNGSYIVTGVQLGSTTTYSFNFAGLAAGNWYTYVKNTDGNLSNVRLFTLYNVAPSISSVSPLNSTNDNANKGIIIFGSLFKSTPTVLFWKDGVQSVPISTGPTLHGQGEIDLGLNLVNIPVGFYNVTVTNPGGLNNNTTAFNAFQVFYPQAPQITDMQPNTGLNNAPINVSINGSGFRSGLTAKLTQASNTIPATNILGGNGSGITCTFDITGKPTGVYNVTVRNNDTQEGTLPSAFTITAPVPPSGNVTAAPLSGVTPLSVQFNVTPSGTAPFTYYWTFGDGASDLTKNPLHNYTVAGTYHPTVNITNIAGSSGPISAPAITANVPVPPVANFTAVPDHGFVSTINVNFTDTSVANILTRNWDFGDGTSSQLVNPPPHTYFGVQNYTVNLTVTNATGTNSASKNITVTNRPVADFNATPTNGPAPMNVTFMDLSQYANGWLWTFGDGGNSTQQNPSHNYTAVGVYDVTLRVFNTGGEGTPLTKTGFITVKNPCPVANFTATPTKGDINLTVQFTDNSTGTITNRNWNFGDGTPVSHDTNPVHNYTAVHLYTVSLEVLNSDCNNIITKPDLINATQPKPIADFTGHPANGTAKETVFYAIDQSRNNPTSWHWDFGDGTTSDLQNPTHIYNASGNYYITLTASNEGGTSAPLRRGPVVVRNPRAIANFTGTPTIGTLPLAVQFTDTSSNFPNRWAWEFGDGTFADIQNPVHTYNTAGSYTVYLRVNDTTSDKPYSDIRRTAYITVTKTPFAEFTASPTSGNTPLAVRFTDQSQGNPWRFSWKFGDGAVASAKNPTHIYQRPGVYTVTETVQNMAGFNTTIKKDLITVTELPQANFMVNATSGIAPKAVRFTDTSTGVPDTWSWDFGDGSHSTEKSPVHTYLSYGTYSVQLTVSNGAGSSNLVKPSLITIGTPINADFTFMPAKGDVPLMIQFTDNSEGNPTGFRWQFGDGYIVSTEQNPVHTYTKPGNYTVTLTITTTPGVSSTVSKQVILTGTPVASFKANPTSGSNPLTVQFTDTSSNNPTTWFWSYGDGRYGNVRNPIHTYNSHGTFTVKLDASNQYGSDSATYPNWISVNEFP